MITKVTAVIAALLFAVAPLAFADQNEKHAFASALEETLGHFHALELNLDDNNAELAIVHATHPIAELYDSMKSELQEHDPELDARMQETLTNLRTKTVGVTREDAQAALDEARALIEEARLFVVGEDLSNDPNFKLSLIKTLLETSAAEYAEAISEGEITEMVEFQDGSAFVWRSQQIFDEIKDGLPEHEVEEIDQFYADLWHAYDERSDPSLVQTLVDGINHEIDEITGGESEDEGLHVYFENIEELLADVSKEYANGNTDAALSLATRAYLDNYEFLEAPIAMQDKELMEEIEIMMREELRDMIKQGADASEISAHIDAILEKLEQAERLIPEELMMAGSEEHEEHEEHENEYADLPPLQQIEAGVEPEHVACRSGMELLIKSSNGSPACVKPATAERLVQLGWGTRP
ncbi:MAG TPA: PEFG-CTERM sorting domain-containing protein [Candidatus Nitrosotenuis sp.]|nr:PEFG-CTERM sorting domain-containing protein [Candidatus Nitrosotenuis sp.]